MLKEDATVTARVYDPDQERVATLLERQPQPAGEHSLTWDGRDAAGKLAPDEAYFFTLEAERAGGPREVYDPTVFSGGREQDLTTAVLDRDTGAITYQLPAMSRVRIRLGISGGPLLNTVVDWEPRPAGQVTDYWDGQDRDRLIDLINHPRLKMIISYFDLPENSVIAFGNKATTYLDYKQGLTGIRKEDYPRLEPSAKLSRHYQIPRRQARSPTLTMAFPQQANPGAAGLPELTGKNVVHVALDDASKPHFQDAKFEIVFFLDGEFYAEEETGYSPYNWVWDTAQVKAGTYTLTVNLSGFGDQIGILSKQVKIVR